MHSTKPLEVYSISDTAIDVFSSNGPRYMETRDPSHLTFLPGKKPTKFFIERIDSDAFAAIVQAEPSESLKYRAAFKLAVTRIEGLVDHQTGQTIDTLVPSDVRQLYGNSKAALSREDLLRISPVYLEEIGAVAFARSFLGPASADYYPAPLILQRVWVTRVSCQGAAAFAEARSLEASQKSTKLPAAARKGKAGAKATAVTATARATKRSASARKRRSKSSK